MKHLCIVIFAIGAIVLFTSFQLPKPPVWCPHGQLRQAMTHCLKDQTGTDRWWFPDMTVTPA